MKIRDTRKKENCKKAIEDDIAKGIYISKVHNKDALKFLSNIESKNKVVDTRYAKPNQKRWK